VRAEQSAQVQAAMVCLNILVLLFVATAGSWAGFKNGWKGYEQPDGCVSPLSWPYKRLTLYLNGSFCGDLVLYDSTIGCFASNLDNSLFPLVVHTGR
jgi:hypothetical protein